MVTELVGTVEEFIWVNFMNKHLWLQAANHMEISPWRQKPRIDDVRLYLP